MQAAKLLKDRRLWTVASLAAFFLLLRWSGLTTYLTVETLKANRGALTAWVEQQMPMALVAYGTVYLVAAAFALPGVAFLTLAGGFVFGAMVGTLVTVIAATLGATAVFLFAKMLLGEDALARFGPRAARLSDGIRQNAASYLLVLRLVPLFPFFLVNLVPAFVGVPPRTFVITTFFGIIPGTAVFSLAGAGMGSILDQGGEITPASILTPEILAGLAGLAALSLAAIPLRKRISAHRSDT